MRNRRRHLGPFNARALAGVLLALAVGASTGCKLLSYGAYVARGEEKTVKVKAEYRGLDHQSIAVLVSADNQTLYQFPTAPLAVCQAVSARLKVDLPGVTVIDPQQVANFQRDNPAWETTPYGPLLQRLKVKRIVHIDLSEYSTHEPGNASIWHGVIEGRVNVAGADGLDPDNPVFAKEVRSEYPENDPVGLMESSDQDVQKITLVAFARQVSWLFYDHKETHK